MLKRLIKNVETPQPRTRTMAIIQHEPFLSLPEAPTNDVSGVLGKTAVIKTRAASRHATFAHQLVGSTEPRMHQASAFTARLPVAIHTEQQPTLSITHGTRTLPVLYCGAWRGNKHFLFIEENKERRTVPPTATRSSTWSRRVYTSVEVQY